MITKLTAYEIWVAYDEIEKGNKLIEQVQESVKQGEPLNLRDSFGRMRNIQLGVPVSDTGHRLYDVHPRLALNVMRAHVAEKLAELKILNERAGFESKTDESKDKDL